jgi:hypothetical protein
MRSWVSAVVSALPVFILGCVIVLLGCQFRLANLQAETVGYGLPATATANQHSTEVREKLIAAQQQQQRQKQEQQEMGEGSHRTQKAAVVKDTLVIYVLNEDDPIFRDNFEYFLLAGVQEDSRLVERATPARHYISVTDIRFPALICKATKLAGFTLKLSVSKADHVTSWTVWP